MALYKIISSNDVDAVQGDMVLATSTFTFKARSPSRITVFEFDNVSGSLNGRFDDYYYYYGNGVGNTGLYGNIDSVGNIGGNLSYSIMGLRGSFDTESVFTGGLSRGIDFAGSIINGLSTISGDLTGISTTSPTSTSTGGLRNIIYGVPGVV